MNENKRKFLKTTLLAGGMSFSLMAKDLISSEIESSQSRYGVLVDTTACIGCRSCEHACREAHGIPAGDIAAYQNRSELDKFRRPDNDALTVVNEFANPRNELVPVDVKYQCMHCEKPACVSACIVGAFEKKSQGAVVWDSYKCIGCRYCMVACPFQIPTFDFHKAIEPDIHKCDFCYPRTQEGKLPACVSICPVEALLYGDRNELIRIAKLRIKRYPERYINHIYGEKEVGGTSWMYLAQTDFSNIAFPKHGEKTAPGVSESIQHGIFAYFVPPVALYAWLGSVMWMSKRRAKLEEELNEEEKNA